MSSDVQLNTGRVPPKNRKQVYEGGEYGGYYGAAEAWDGWEEKWEEPHQYVGDHDAGMGYYDGYSDYSGAELAGWESIEVDLYAMVFQLDAHLEPQDLYDGFEFNEKEFVFTLEADDILNQSPQAWKSRPLKIHPEPAPKKPSAPAVVAWPSTSAVAAVKDADAGTSTCSPGRGLKTSPKGSPDAVESPKAPAVPVVSVFTSSPVQRSEADAGGGPAAKESTGSPKTASTPLTTPSAKAANPKIVISESQLEHLKIKMQALKKKHNPVPLTLPPSTQQEKPLAEEKKASMDESSPQQRLAPLAVSNCPGAHGLKFFQTPDDGWWCSKCNQERSKGTSFYGCRLCDYDECERCSLSMLPKRSPPSTKALAAPDAASSNGSGASLGSRDSPGSGASPGSRRSHASRGSRASAGTSNRGPSSGEDGKDAALPRRRHATSRPAQGHRLLPRERRSSGLEKRVARDRRESAQESASLRTSRDDRARRKATAMKRRVTERSAVSRGRVEPDESDRSSASETWESPLKKRVTNSHSAGKAAVNDSDSNARRKSRGSHGAGGVSLTRSRRSTSYSTASVAARTARETTREALRALGLRRPSASAADSGTSGAPAAAASAPRGRGGQQGGDDLLRRVLQANRDQRGPGGVPKRPSLTGTAKTGTAKTGIADATLNHLQRKSRRV